MAPQTSRMRINVFDGTRQAIQKDVKVLMTIIDGYDKQIVRNDYPPGQPFEVPFITISVMTIEFWPTVTATPRPDLPR